MQKRPFLPSIHELQLLLYCQNNDLLNVESFESKTVISEIIVFSKCNKNLSGRGHK